MSCLAKVFAQIFLRVSCLYIVRDRKQREKIDTLYICIRNVFWLESPTLKVGRSIKIFSINWKDSSKSPLIILLINSLKMLHKVSLYSPSGIKKYTSFCPITFKLSKILQTNMNRKC